MYTNLRVGTLSPAVSNETRFSSERGYLEIISFLTTETASRSRSYFRLYMCDTRGAQPTTTGMLHRGSIYGRGHTTTGKHPYGVRDAAVAVSGQRPTRRQPRATRVAVAPPARLRRACRRQGHTTARLPPRPSALSPPRPAALPPPRAASPRRGRWPSAVSMAHTCTQAPRTRGRQHASKRCAASAVRRGAHTSRLERRSLASAEGSPDFDFNFNFHRAETYAHRPRRAE